MHGRHSRLEPDCLADGQRRSGAFGGGDHRVQVGKVERHRLLHLDVLARPQGRERLRRVLGGRGADVDAHDDRVGKDRGQVGRGPGAAGPAGEPTGAGEVAAHDIADLDVRERAQCLEMIPGDDPGAYEGDDVSAHAPSPECSSTCSSGW